MIKELQMAYWKFIYIYKFKEPELHNHLANLRIIQTKKRLINTIKWYTTTEREMYCVTSCFEASVTWMSKFKYTYMHTEMNISLHQCMQYFIYMNLITCKSYSNMTTYKHAHACTNSRIEPFYTRRHDWTSLDRWLYQNRAHASVQCKRDEASTRTFRRLREAAPTSERRSEHEEARRAERNALQTTRAFRGWFARLPVVIWRSWWLPIRVSNFLCTQRNWCRCCRWFSSMIWDCPVEITCGG